MCLFIRKLLKVRLGKVAHTLNLGMWMVVVGGLDIWDHQWLRV